MQLSKTLMASLSRLIQGEKIAGSSLRPDMASDLISEGLITVYSNGSRKRFCAINTNALKDYLTSNFDEFRNLEAMKNLMKQDEQSRSEQARISGNSKLISARSCPGFPVTSYDDIECSLSGKSVRLKPDMGSFQFIYDWNTFSVPQDIVIIGIENMENFIKIRDQRNFFTRYLNLHHTDVKADRILFVSRYPQSTDLRSWLKTIPNKYIHFGDFDLAGINIFLTEFYNHIGKKASFLIPDDIEERIASGSTRRYNEQYRKFKSLSAPDQDLENLISMIHRYRRCYDQEGYIL